LNWRKNKIIKIREKKSGASGNSMGDMTEGRNLAILEAWKTKNSMRSY